tara:strand:- start:168 stop:539 length:372 start_codon:yes stop_codon:yes gene_type:complete
MIKFLTKQFLYGRLYLWAKERLSGIFLGIVIIFLIIYIHSEYLNYVEFKEKSSNSYVGISFIIKNTLILLVALGYFYFYSILGKTKKLIEDDENIPNKKRENETERVENLDYFLNDDEINRDR